MDVDPDALRAMTIGVALAGASTLSGDALERALDTEVDLEVVTTTRTFDDTIAVFDDYAIDVALVDVRCDPAEGLRLVRWIPAHVPGCAVVVLAVSVTDRLVVESYTARSLALVTEEITCVELVEVIRDAAAGLRMISAEDARAAHQRLRSLGHTPTDRLSEADTVLAGLISNGLTDAEIAACLNLGVQTVRNRVSRLLRTLGLANRVQLAVFACRHLDPASVTDIPPSRSALPCDR